MPRIDHIGSDPAGAQFVHEYVGEFVEEHVLPR
jgi:hypothetical protein